MTKYLRVSNVTRETVLADQVGVARDVGSRLRGLLGRAGLAPGEGLWIEPCSAVHTYFMRFPIDVAFLDDRRRVLRGMTLLPWRLSPWVRGARGVLELPAGVLSAGATRPGDVLRFTDGD